MLRKTDGLLCDYRHITEEWFSAQKETHGDVD